MLFRSTQLEQAFLNLILNAVEAMPEGGRLTVTTRTSPGDPGDLNGGEVVIEFKDTGAGMTEEQSRRAFSSLLNTTKRHGAGLGLAIVNRVVETHRGRVKIKSRVGEGTAVVIQLPMS